MLRIAVGMLIVSVLACSENGPNRQGIVAVDSAGIAVVTISQNAALAPEFWVVETDPDWTVGEIEEGPEHDLDRIVGAATLSDGSIAVADMGSAQVRVFDSSGRFVRSIGRAGSGPGEFRQLTGLFHAGNDLLVARDGLEALHVYREDGTFLTTHRTGTLPISLDPVTMQLTPFSQPVVVGVFADSSYLATELTPVTLSPAREFTAPETVDVIIKRGRIGAAVASELLRLQGPTYHPHPMNLVVPAVHGPEVFSSVTPSGFIVAHSGAAEIRWYNGNAELERITRFQWPREPVTQGMINQYVQLSVPPLREDLARARTFAEILPAFSAVMTDAVGRIWLRHYEPAHGATLSQYIPTFLGPSTWAVLDQEGLPVASVELPARFTPLEIGVDHVLGIYRDELDVESLRRHRLRSGSPPHAEP